MKNGFCQIELMTGNAAKAKQFYGRLFGWKLQDVPMGPGQFYTVIAPGSGPGGGIMQKAKRSDPTAWMVYVNVTNLKRSVTKAKKLGAKVLVAEKKVAGYGAYAMLKDPTGAVFHLWQPHKKTTGN